jgi:peptidyl-tRNA hydrolase
VLASKGYARLRVGIGSPDSKGIPLEKYVLTPFLSEEEKNMGALLERAQEACKRWLEEPIERVMEWVNQEA